MDYKEFKEQFVEAVKDKLEEMDLGDAKVDLQTVNKPNESYEAKAIYKDNADTIIGNMDSQVFLGGSEQTTLKDLNTTLGKETIDMYNTGETRGTSQSYNMNYQKLGKDLMTIDELAVMDGSKCIVQVRGVRPFLSDKYDLTQHPNYKLTSDYDKRNLFDIEKFLNHNLILKADDEYEVIEVIE